MNDAIALIRSKRPTFAKEGKYGPRLSTALRSQANMGHGNRNSLCADRDCGGLPALRVYVVDHHVPPVINEIAMPVTWL